MNAKKRAMSAEKASKVKKRGHYIEHVFAEKINGRVQKGDQKSKKDVIDLNDNTHSVKSGTWWQIFLYGYERIITNTILLGLGNLSKIIATCINAFPKERTSYLKNKKMYKNKLKEPMIQLCKELQTKVILESFFAKSIFNGGEVNYLTVLLDNYFHIFAAKDVTSTLTNRLTIENSKARIRTQTDAQKVLFKDRVNVGEIEIRNDSDIHYRQIKFRLNARKTTNILIENIQPYKVLENKKIKIYGNACKKFTIETV